MDSNQLISIIIPAYNIDQYLARCLDSVLGQTYNNLEVIVISDGSVDGTNDIIKQYADADSRIKYILKQNTGVSDTRNKGLEIATGDYIGFVDGDDYVEPNMFEILYENMMKYDADISHCGYQMVFPSKVVYYHGTDNLYQFNQQEGVEAIIKADLVEPGIWNKLYKREVVEQIRFDARLVESEDFLYNICAFKNCNKSVFVDKPLYHYILRNNSACTSAFNIKKTDNQILVMEILTELLPEKQYQELIEFRYINTLVGAYRTSCMENQVQEGYRLRLKNKRASFGIVSKSRRIEAQMIIQCSGLYRICMRMYKRFLYKNPYEVE